MTIATFASCIHVLTSLSHPWPCPVDVLPIEVVASAYSNVRCLRSSGIGNARPSALLLRNCGVDAGLEPTSVVSTQNEAALRAGEATAGDTAAGFAAAREGCSVQLVALPICHISCHN